MDKYLILIKELQEKKEIVTKTLQSFSIDIDNKQNSFDIRGDVVTFSLNSKNRFLFTANKEKIKGILKENNLVLKD